MARWSIPHRSPLGGAVLYVSVDWVEPIDITFNQLVDIYMSMGAISHRVSAARGNVARGGNGE